MNTLRCAFTSKMMVSDRTDLSLSCLVTKVVRQVTYVVVCRRYSQQGPKKKGGERYPNPLEAGGDYFIYILFLRKGIEGRRKSVCRSDGHSIFTPNENPEQRGKQNKNKNKKWCSPFLFRERLYDVGREIKEGGGNPDLEGKLRVDLNMGITHIWEREGLRYRHLCRGGGSGKV